jgi:hypothetical protein
MESGWSVLPLIAGFVLAVVLVAGVAILAIKWWRS